jgi:hypothetical protein
MRSASHGKHPGNRMAVVMGASRSPHPLRVATGHPRSAWAPFECDLCSSEDQRVRANRKRTLQLFCDFYLCDRLILGISA